MSTIRLPQYVSYDGKTVVEAGRIHSRQALRLNVSTAPLGQLVSSALGYPLLPIHVGEVFLNANRPDPGAWLVRHVTGERRFVPDAAVFTANEFSLTFTLKHDPNPVLLRDAREPNLKSLYA